MPSLFSKTQPAFGLDISDTSLKFLQLEGNGRSTEVKGFAEADLPKGLVINDAITNTQTFSYLLSQAMEKPKFGRLSTAHAVVNLPESKSFVRVIQIPRMGNAEIETSVPFEAESFIPLPIDQVYLDWQKLEVVGDKINVLIIASPKEFVNAYLGVLEKSGIIPVALEVESQGRHRALVEAGSKETVLVVDVSATRTSLVMVERGNLQFTSTIPLAGNTFTDSIAKSLGVSTAKAEAIKQKVGISNTAEYPNIKTALLPVLNNLSAEIKNILKFHNEHSGAPVEKIIFSGGGARMKNLIGYLTPEFSDTPGIALELGNPWKNIVKLSAKPMDDFESLSYSGAIGMAMRGLNFSE